MSASDTVAAPEQGKAVKKKGRSKLLTLGIPLLLVLLGAGGGGWWYFAQAAAAGPPVEKPATGLLPLDPFVVNLADTGGRRFLRATVLLVLSDEVAAKKLKDNALLSSRVRSSILELLSLRTSAELATPEGRSGLKLAIAETATQTSGVGVHDVLFHELVVQ